MPNLIGTAPNQVPTNGSLGNMAFQNKEAVSVDFLVTVTLTATNATYTGTLTGGTGIVNLGSGQFYKDASGNVGIGTTTPAAKFDVTSTTSGFLPPRMSTAQRDAISSPPDGSVIYNNTTGTLQVRQNGQWVSPSTAGVVNVPASLDLDFINEFYSARRTTKTFNQLIDFTRTSAATYVDASGRIVPTPASRNLLTFTQEFENAGWTKMNATVTANSTTAPDGTLTGDTLVANPGAAVHNVGQNTSVTMLPYTWSIYAKAGTSSFMQLVHTASSNTYANFDLATGALGAVGASAVASITSVGNGWYRCSMTFTPTTASIMRAAIVTSASAAFNESWTATGTESILIWGAQLEQVPDASLTLGSALITPETGPYSSVPGGVSGVGSPQTTSIVSGAIRTEVTGAVTSSARQELSFACTSGKVYRVAITVNSNAGFDNSSWVNLLPSSAASTPSGARSVTYYVTATATGTAIIRMYPRSAAGASQQVGDFVETSAISIREITGTTGMPTTYTRNFGGVYPPRFDYDPVTLAPKGLLVEEQRTNLLLRSEEFDNAAWVKNAATIASNVTTAPDGTSTAEKLIADSGSLLTSSYARQPITKNASPTTYTSSIYAKAAEYNRIRYTVRDNSSGSNNAAVTVSLVDGSIVSAAAATGTFSNASATVTSAGNGWYRIALSYTTGSETSIWGGTPFAADATATTGDGTSGIYVWGVQLEYGAFATSYIPTVASQVTRTADVATITGANFSQFYNQSEGTFVVEGVTQKPSSLAATVIAIDASDGSINNRHYIGVVSASAEARTVNSGSVQSTLNQAYSANSVEKYAYAVKVNDFAFARNGSIVGTDTSGAMPTIDRMFIGNAAGSAAFFNGHIRSIRFYPTRLSNAQLQALTT